MDDKTIHIAITMPADGSATIVMSRGNLAVTHTYIGRIPGGHNDKHAMERAYEKLEALEADPPVVPDAPPPKTKDKKQAKAAGEPTIEIPVGKKKQRIPISRLKLTGGETDGAAYKIAARLAGRLLESGLWDGETPLLIPDVYKLQAKMKPYQVKELTLYSLEELLEAATPQPMLMEVPLVKDGDDLGDDEPDDDEPDDDEPDDDEPDDDEPDDDEPDDDEPDDDEPDDDEQSKQNVSSSSLGINPGVNVTWGENIVDVDDEVIPFDQGRVVEVDGDECWVESLDGECDTWIATANLIVVL